MAEYFAAPVTGSEANAGTNSDAPKQLMLGQAGNTFPAAAAGDVMRVQQGELGTVRLVLPANNLRYSGFGGGGEPFTVTVPGTDPAQLQDKLVSAGGLWELAGDAANTGHIACSTRFPNFMQGFDVTDKQASPVVSVGTSTAAATQVGATFEAFRISDAPLVGLYGTLAKLTLRDAQYLNSGHDAISITPSSNNLGRAGYHDYLWNLDIRYPGSNSDQLNGDAIELLPTNAGEYLAPVDIRNVYVVKRRSVKQAVNFGDAIAGITMNGFHMRGELNTVPADIGDIGLMFTRVRGAVRFKRGVIKRAGLGNPMLRGVGSAASVIGAGDWILAAGATVLAEGILYAPTDSSQIPPVFYWGGSGTVSNVAGKVTLRHITVAGVCFSSASYAAVFSAQDNANTVLQAGAGMAVQNCVVLQPTTIPMVWLPAGAANSADYPVENNVFPPGSTFKIGATTYATLAEFEAAHSFARGNQLLTAVECRLDSNYKPLADSPLKGAGKHLGFVVDIAGRLRNCNPTIGAYE
jgi:hypothetical protein